MQIDGQTPYARLGGLTVVRQIVEKFYQLLDQDTRYSAVRALHGADLAATRQGLLEFLAGWLGGPPLYFQRPQNRCVMSAHAKVPIGAGEMQQWLDCMAQSLQDCGVEQRLALRIQDALERMARRMRNKP